MSKAVKPNAQERIEQAVAKHWNKRGEYTNTVIDSAKGALDATVDAVDKTKPIWLGVGAFFFGDQLLDVAEQAVEAEQVENQISYAEYIARK